MNLLNTKNNGKLLFSSCLTGMYDSMALFPATLATCVCTGFGIHGAVITAILCTVFSMISKTVFIPSWLTVLPVFCLNYRFGTAAAGAAIALSGIFAFVLSRFIKKGLLLSEVKIAFIVAGAFCTTALQTTNYFGIGAVGADTVEIIKDYISLGFHGNWRGVLYGTVVLVIMVTYPRKFKNFSKKVPASFLSVAVTLIMNLFLNPDREFTAIDEIGYMSFVPFSGSAFLKDGFDVRCIPLVLCTAFAIALTVTEFSEDREKLPRKNLVVSAVNTAGGFMGAVPVYSVSSKKRNVAENLACAVFTMLFFFLCPSVFSRIPLHSLAVILIVGAWQSVDWHGISTVFGKGKKSVLIFTVSLFVTVIAGAHYALPMLLLLSVAGNNGRKEKSAESF